MWWNHIKFGIAVVLITIITVLGNICDKIIDHPKSGGVTWEFYKDTLRDTRDSLYYK